MTASRTSPDEPLSSLHTSPEEIFHTRPAVTSIGWTEIQSKLLVLAAKCGQRRRGLVQPRTPHGPTGALTPHRGGDASTPWEAGVGCRLASPSRVGAQVYLGRITAVTDVSVDNIVTIRPRRPLVTRRPILACPACHQLEIAWLGNL